MAFGPSTGVQSGSTPTCWSPQAADLDLLCSLCVTSVTRVCVRNHNQVQFFILNCLNQRRNMQPSLLQVYLCNSNWGCAAAQKAFGRLGAFEDRDFVGSLEEQLSGWGWTWCCSVYTAQSQNQIIAKIKIYTYTYTQYCSLFRSQIFKISANTPSYHFFWENSV